MTTPNPRDLVGPEAYREACLVFATAIAKGAAPVDAIILALHAAGKIVAAQQNSAANAICSSPVIGEKGPDRETAPTAGSGAPSDAEIEAIRARVQRGYPDASSAALPEILASDLRILLSRIASLEAERARNKSAEHLP